MAPEARRPFLRATASPVCHADFEEFHLSDRGAKNFPLGPRALQVATRQEIDACLRRHAAGDWGVVDSVGRNENDDAVKNGCPLMSIYMCRENTLWIMTDGDPRHTSVLTPAGYYNGSRTPIVRRQGPKGALAKALGWDVKGKISPALYAAAIGCAFIAPWISYVIFVGVALIWLVPDPRIERLFGDED